MLSAPAIERYAMAALTRECEEVARTASGRNARLNRAAFSLGGLVGGGYLLRADVEGALFEAAVACGYVAKDGPRQARDTIRSGLERGTLEPRDPPARDSEPSQPDPRERLRQAQARERQRRARETEDAAKAARVGSIWQEAQPDPRGTLVEMYLNRHRHLDLPKSVCGHALRFHPAGPWGAGRAPMMVAAFRDLGTNQVVGLHRTRLDPTTGAKVDRKMLGRAGGAAIKLTPDVEVTSGLALAEGVESALAGIALGFAPMWAMGSVGGIASFPTLPGVESLTVCAETGEASERAVQEVGIRWTDAGREVRVVRPRLGSDLNDAIRGAMR